MDLLARFALPGILALSAAGSLIVGVLLVRYGFVPPEEDIDDAEQRVSATRMAHALIAACLAGIAVLSVAALVARPAAPSRAATAALEPAAPETPVEPAARPDTPGPGQAAAGDTAAASGVATSAPRETVSPSPPREERTKERETRAREDEVGRLRAHVAALEARLDRQDAAGGAALPPREEARAETPARTMPPRSTAPQRTGARPTTTATSEDVAALPVLVGKPQMSTTIQGVRVDVHRQAGDGHDTIYTIRLAASGNRPLTDADVSLLGRTKDGLPVSAALVPAREPGFYRTRVAAQSAEGLRLRVVHASARFEVSLDHAVSW